MIASHKPEAEFLRLIFSSLFLGMGWDTLPPYGNRVILVELKRHSSLIPLQLSDQRLGVVAKAMFE